MSGHIRAYQYPILEERNLSFPGGSFEHVFTGGPGRCSATLTHKLQGCPFIERLITRREAVYSCAVSIPVTGYRRLHTSETETQQIEWSEDDLGEPPYFRPLVVAVKDIRRRLTEDDGVGPEWAGQEVRIERGAKLGFGHFYQMKSSMENLVTIHKDTDLPDGVFIVDDPCTTHGFHFKVRMAAGLYRFVQHPGDARLHRKSVLTHVVSSCFERLRRDYRDGDGEEGWRSHSNLRALADIFGALGLTMWDDPDFSPEEAATRMYPHKPPRQDADSDPDADQD